MSRDYFNFIPIFNFHEIGEQDNLWTLTKEKFNKFISWLYKNDFEIISMKSLLTYYNQGIYPQNKVVITFDDGRKGILNNGLEILKYYDAPATVYLVYDWLHNKINYQKEMYSEFLNSNDVIYLAHEHDFSWGYHTKTHRDITELEYSDMIYETITSKNILENELDLDIQYFSYPYGKFTREIEEKLKKEYLTIVSSDRKWNNNLFHLPRISLKSYHTEKDYEKFFCLSEWCDL